MTEQSQLLAGQLLNELEEINQNLSDSLDLDNLGRTGSLAAPNTQITNIMPAPATKTNGTVAETDVEQAPEEFEEDLLEEFTQALHDEAESLAELYFSEGFEDAHAISPQSIKNTVERIAEFNLKLLNKFLIQNNQQESTTQAEEGHPQEPLSAQQA